MTAKVILNPYSGRWTAQKRQPEAENALRAAGVDFDLVITKGPGDGLALARQAVLDGYSPIISAGGDGSVSEVVNGMMQADGTRALPPLGILPLGSGNDLVYNLRLPLDLNSAAKTISGGKTQMMDLCQVNGRFFDNNSAIGLEPYITLIQQRIHKIRGTSRYLLATVMGVLDNPNWVMDLEWEGGSYSGPITLVTIGNSPRTGGLFYVTPHANPFDNLLTFVYGYLPTRLKIFQLLPRTMKSGEGNYVEHPAIHEIHTPWLRIHSNQPTPMHADGEIQSEAIQDLEYRILPACLPILMNESK